MAKMKTILERAETDARALARLNKKNAKKDARTNTIPNGCGQNGAGQVELSTMQHQGKSEAQPQTDREVSTQTPLTKEQLGLQAARRMTTTIVWKNGKTRRLN